MGMQPTSDAYESDSVIPFAPSAKNAVSDDTDQLDKAGQTILKLLHKAANVAEANNQHALEMAQKLSQCAGRPATSSRCKSDVMTE
jgi:hypothetical protein